MLIALMPPTAAQSREKSDDISAKLARYGMRLASIDAEQFSPSFDTSGSIQLALPAEKIQFEFLNR